MSSPSIKAREQGNEFYKKAGAAGLAPVLQDQRYKTALKYYNQASLCAANSDEMASASKNIANTCFKIAEVSEKKLHENRLTIGHYYQEAIKYFNAAFEEGSSSKSYEWKSNIISTLGLCLEEAINWADGLESFKERLQTLEFFGRDIIIRPIAIEYQLKIGKLIFHDGATKLQNGDYKGSLSRMKDCYFHLEEAKRMGRSIDDGDRDQEIEILQQDVHYQTTTAESMQARERGKQVLAVALREEEALQMDMVWEAIDWYKQSTIFARELDLEQEAISLSCLGSVYDKVLKQKAKAKVYFMRTLQLADSLRPRTFTTEEWYKNALSTIKRYQDEVRQRDEQEEQRNKAGILKDLEKEMKQLKEEDVGRGGDLLKFCYNTFPPKAKSWKLPDNKEMEGWENLGREELKAVLKKGIIVYHPDKVDEETHGKKWKVFSEEIYKRLSQRYEWLK